MAAIPFSRLHYNTFLGCLTLLAKRRLDETVLHGAADRAAASPNGVDEMGIPVMPGVAAGVMGRRAKGTVRVLGLSILPRPPGWVRDTQRNVANR